MPKLSIILPVYNSAPYLDRCIESIINQNYIDFELIIIDDDSTDDSLDICRNFEKNNNRIIIIHQKNQGQSSARNTGLRYASGDYISFVDSDDWIDNSFYVKAISKFEINDYDVVIGKMIISDKNNKFTYQMKKPIPSEIEFDNYSAMKELLSNQTITYSFCDKVFKSDILKGFQFRVGTLYEDKDLIYKIIHKTNKIRFINHNFYYYRYNPHSSTRKRFSLDRIDNYFVTKEMYLFYIRYYKKLSNKAFSLLFNIGSGLFALLVIYEYNHHKYEYMYCFPRRKVISAFFSKGIKLKIRIKMFIYFISPKILKFFLISSYKTKFINEIKV